MVACPSKFSVSAATAIDGSKRIMVRRLGWRLHRKRCWVSRLWCWRKVTIAEEMVTNTVSIGTKSLIDCFICLINNKYVPVK